MEETATARVEAESHKQKALLAKQRGALLYLIIPSAAFAAFVLLPAGMAPHTILEIGNALLKMLRTDLGFVVLMTSIAGVSREVARVTGSAGCPAAVIQGEGMWSVELRRRPCGCAVTGSAVCTEHAGVKSRLGMTGNACCGQPLELPAAMTALTRHVHVRAGQREVAAAVVEGGVLPTGRVVTGGAVRAKLTVMLVILTVAGVAIAGRAFVHIVQVALLTAHIRMFPFEFERRQVVVEFGRRPAIRRMAEGAISAKAPLVRLVSVMAGVTILRRGGKICQRTGIHVTLHARHAAMLPRQFEGKVVVIETRHEAIHPIVTIQTRRTERQHMPRHEP